MENLKVVITYLGGHLKYFAISVFLKFMLYMSLLFLILVVFFSSPLQMRGYSVILLIVLFLVVADFLINRILMIKYTLNFQSKFLDQLDPDRAVLKTEIKRGEWTSERTFLKKELNSRIHGPVTAALLDSLAVLKLKTGGLNDKPDSLIQGFYRDQLKQWFFEKGTGLITALPFFLISMLLTAGLRGELRFLSFVLALIFYFFIRSAVFIPLFSLLRIKKISKNLIF